MFTHWIHNELDVDRLTEDDWIICQIFYTFLQAFYENTISLSAIYTPTSKLVLHALLDIAICLSKYKDVALLKPVVQKIQTKFRKCWEELPYLYCFGIILDPRLKMTTLYEILHHLGEHIGVYYLTTTLLPLTKSFMNFTGRMKKNGWEKRCNLQSMSPSLFQGHRQ